MRLKGNDELGEQSMGRTTRLTYKAGYNNRMATHYPLVQTDEISAVSSMPLPDRMPGTTHWAWVIMNVDHVHRVVKQIQRRVMFKVDLA